MARADTTEAHGENREREERCPARTKEEEEHLKGNRAFSLSRHAVTAHSDEQTAHYDGRLFHHTHDKRDFLSSVSTGL
jgi:hypothetical protein